MMAMLNYTILSIVLRVSWLSNVFVHGATTNMWPPPRAPKPIQPAKHGFM